MISAHTQAYILLKTYPWSCEALPLSAGLVRSQMLLACECLGYYESSHTSSSLRYTALVVVACAALAPVTRSRHLLPTAAWLDCTPRPPRPPLSCAVPDTRA